MSAEDQDFVVLDIDDVDDVDELAEPRFGPLPAEKLSKIRKWLQPTDYLGPSSEYGKHRDAQLPGTGAWVLKTDQYRQWHDSQDRGALWIKATAGAGKSVIAASLASKLSSEENVPVLFFFFRHIVSANQKPQSLVRDYMSQVLEHCPGLQHSLFNFINEGRSLESVAFDELWRIMAAALTRLPRVYCVADALDEMDGENEGFLRDILALSRRMPDSIKILLTSRPLPRMEQVFRDSYVLQIGLQPQLVDPDIALYVAHRASEFDVSERLRLCIHETMCARAEGHFLYARLMLDELQQSSKASLAPEESLISALDRLPVPMADMYTQMLLDHSRRSGVPQELQIALLQWVTRSERPLRLLELSAMIEFRQIALGISKNTKSVVREGCGPLLEILEDETVCPIHHSLTEYLYDTSRSDAGEGNAGFPVLDYSDAQRAIALTCVKYLGSGWHLGPVPADKSVHPGIKRLDTTRLRLDYALLDYAVRNWWKHLRKSEARDPVMMIPHLDALFLHDPSLLHAWLQYPQVDTPLPFGLGFDVAEWAAIHAAANLGIGFYVGHLIGNGTDIESLDSESRTPLTIASIEGHHQVVDILLQRGCRNDIDDKEGLKPLHYAARQNHHHVVKLLLESGVDPLTKKTKENPGRHCGNAPITIGETPVQYACQGGHVESLKEFIPYMTSKDLQLALHQALRSRHLKVAQALLDCPGIDVNFVSQGQTPLHLACTARDPDLMQRMIDMGANVDKLSQRHSSGGFHFFIRQGCDTALNVLHAFARADGRSEQTVDHDAALLMRGFKMLLDAGLNPNSTTSEGFNALHCMLMAQRSCTAEKRPSLDPTITYLIERGVPAASATKDGSNALHIASNIPTTTIDLLISQGVRIDQVRGSDGKTPLMLSIEQHSLQYARDLLSRGADSSITDNEGNTVLHLLTKKISWGGERVAFAKALLDAGCNVNARNKVGDTPMHLRNEKNEFLELFFEYGFDPEAKNGEGQTILFQAIGGYSSHKREYRDLLDMGCSPKVRNSRGATTLHLLVELTDGGPDGLALMRLMIQKGVDPLSTDYSGNTLWHTLASATGGFHGKNRDGVMDLLMEYQVPEAAKNNAGWTPLHVACFQGSACYSPEAIDCWLERANADIDAAGYDRIRPIHIASAASSSLTCLLLDKGADAAALTIDGQSPLTVACRNQQWETICVLLDHYKAHNQLCLVNQADSQGRSALHYACKSGRPEIAALLLDAGAQVDIRDSRGMTPLSICAECVEELPSLGIQEVPRQDTRSAETALILLPSEPGPNYRGSQQDPPRIRETVRLLIAGGADTSFLTTIPSGYDVNSEIIQNPLRYSVKKGYEPMVSELLIAQKKLLDSGGSRAQSEVQASGQAGTDHELEAANIKKYWKRVLSFYRNRTHFLRMEHMSELVADYMKPGTNGASKLKEFLQDDNEPAVKEALRLGTSLLELQTPHGDNALLQMASWGCTDLMRSIGQEARLMNAEWAEEQSGPDGRQLKSILHQALVRDLPNIEMLKLLVSDFKHNPNERYLLDHSRASESLIHVAARQSNWWQRWALEFLLENGGDVDNLDSKQETPLISALRRSSSNRHRVVGGDAVEILLAHGANPDAVDKEGLTCLNIAASQPTYIKLLLKYGANPGLGSNPFIFDAIAQQDVHVLRIIVESGAEVNCRIAPRPEAEMPAQRHGSRRAPRRNVATLNWRSMGGVQELQLYAYPVHVAASHIFNCGEKRSRAIEMINLLLKAGANTSLTYEDGRSVAHVLAETGGILDPFLDRSAFDMEARDGTGRTLLLAACDFSPSPNFEVSGLDSLVKHGASLAATDHDGCNALHHLIRKADKGHSVLMQAAQPFLSSLAAQPFFSSLAAQPDAAGRTPLHYAVAGNQLNLIDTLVEHGADLAARDPLDGSSALHHLVCGLSWRDELMFHDTRTILNKEQLLKISETLGKDSATDDDIRKHMRSTYFATDGLVAAERSSARRYMADLLARGVHIDARDDAGNTPLFMLALKWPQAPHRGENWLLESMRVLEAAGADLTARNNSGESVLHKLAAQQSIDQNSWRWRGWLETGASRDAELTEATRWLVAQGVDVTWEDEHSRTCLDVAASTGAGWMLDMYKRK